MSRKKNKIKNIGCFILDKSGSMTSLKSTVLSGFEEYLNTLQKKKVDSKFYLTLFDSESIERPYEGTALNDVEPLTDSTYQPLGMTPLYDAVVSTLKRMEMQVDDMKDTAISVVIMTDGFENHSQEYNEKDLIDLVKRLSNKGNWTFAYMGANQDAWATAAKLGIQRNNVMRWDNTLKGTRSAFSNLANASVNYVSAMNIQADAGKELNSKDFFAKEK